MLHRQDYTIASRCARAIKQYRADQFEAEALDYAEAHGWEVKVTHWGVEFYDADGGEVEHWDFEE